jgi:hypothetical protein
VDRLYDSEQSKQAVVSTVPIKPKVTFRDWAIVLSRRGKGFARLEYEAFKLAYKDVVIPSWEDIEKEVEKLDNV